MYAGHFALGLAIKAKSPETPAFPIMLGIGFIDIVYGILVMAGIDRVTPDLHSGPYLFFDLTFVDWDHSLLMSLFWSLIWGALFIANKRVAVIAGLACFSHFLADWPLHNGDMALFPFSQFHFGGGLWGRLGIASWWLEGAFSGLLAAYAWRSSAKRGVNLLWPTLLLMVLFLQLSPWTSPMQFIARLGEPAVHLLNGAMVALGFIVPGLLMTWLLNRAERQAGHVV